MQTYQLPDQVRGLLFDMDLTLYKHEDYYKSQIKNQVILLSQELGREPEDLEAELGVWELDYRARHQGKSPSFGNLLLGALGVPISRSVELRRQAIRPEDYLEKDSQLEAALEALIPFFRLILVTNNPSDIARRTLAVLGVDRFFPEIVGLEESGHSKPHPRAFELAYKLLALKPSETISIGDRYAVDLEVPLSWGAGGILVETMEDVYDLPALLRGKIVVDPLLR